MFSSLALILVNLIPLYGAVYHGWNVQSIMILYWMENVIIGVFSVLKMFKAEGQASAMQFASVRLNGRPMSSFTQATALVKRSFFIPFFMLHFGMFTFVHGIFTFIFFYSSQINWLGVGVSFLSMIASHTVSYLINFLGNQEYKNISVEKLFISPYPRVIVMHLTVILGGMFAMNNQGVFALVVLVVLKTIADLFSHVFEHRFIAKPTARYVGYSTEYRGGNKVGESDYDSPTFQSEIDSSLFSRDNTKSRTKALRGKPPLS